MTDAVVIQGAQSFPVVVGGVPGPAGASAYELAVEAGFAGTEDEWLASFANRPEADLFIVFGQSLTVGRAPQVTAPGSVVPSLLMFNGGSECQNMTTPVPPAPVSAPVSPTNMASLTGFMPEVGKEGWGPGLGYQSALAGVGRAFFFAPGMDSMSLRLLHFAHMMNLRHGLRRAVRLLRRAGYEPTIHFIFEQGHANADALGDGNEGGETPTTTAQYLLGAGKLFQSMRVAASTALGETFTGPIWVVPMVTANSIASVAAKRDIANAHAALPVSVAGSRLLPPRSQFANEFASDLTHPLGAGYRHFAELAGAYIRSGLTPPRIVSKAVVGSDVQVTFDQPVKLSATTADLLTPGNSRKGFQVIDNAAAAVAVTNAVAAGNVVTLTVASVANLTGTWFVRNGLQQNNAIGDTGTPANDMPRTLIVGTTDVGTAQDGTVLENFSIPQEV